VVGQKWEFLMELISQPHEKCHRFIELDWRGGNRVDGENECLGDLLQQIAWSILASPEGREVEGQLFMILVITSRLLHF
jgi:hypothetical protein